MSKKVLVLSTSMRKGGNSDILAKAFVKGAESSGNTVEYISIADKTIHFCKGCLICQKTQKCIIKDDAVQIADKMKESDVVVFATPIYYYEMSGQMKTLLDRMNPLYPSDYSFRDVYMIATAAEQENEAMDRAIQGLEGWIECFPKASLKGVICGTGVVMIGDVSGHAEVLQEAFNMGAAI